MGDLIGVELPIFEILLIGAGLSMLYKAFVGKRDKEE